MWYFRVGIPTETILSEVVECLWTLLCCHLLINCSHGDIIPIVSVLIHTLPESGLWSIFSNHPTTWIVFVQNLLTYLLSRSFLFFPSQLCSIFMSTTLSFPHMNVYQEIVFQFNDILGRTRSSKVLSAKFKLPETNILVQDCRP